MLAVVNKSQKCFTKCFLNIQNICCRITEFREMMKIVPKKSKFSKKDCQKHIFCQFVCLRSDIFFFSFECQQSLFRGVDAVTRNFSEVIIFRFFCLFNHKILYFYKNCLKKLVFKQNMYGLLCKFTQFKVQSCVWHKLCLAKISPM